MADPLSGEWTNGRESMYLRYDGERSVTGAVTSGRSMAPIKRGVFDAATGALHLEGEALTGHGDQTAPFVIDGRLAGGRVGVRFKFAEFEGEATFDRVTLGGVLKRMADGVAFAVRQLFSSSRNSIPGMMDSRRRSKEENEAGMRERGETLESLKIREAVADDIPALSHLHVLTWAMTYPRTRHPPTYAIRSWQWTELFAKPTRNWFCYVIENEKGELVGFAKGIQSNATTGDLNKIYLRWEYHRLGLGKRMLGAVTRRFTAIGVTSMTVHAEADNPTCRFYEGMGGVPMVDEKTGKSSRGSYIWRDLPALAARCPD